VTKLLPPNAEPRRVKKFRLELAKVIPRFPNDQASLEYLHGQRLRDILVHYLNWRSRYVGIRRRSVSVEAPVQADPRWIAHSAAIEAFLDKVRNGDDLTQHLSILPHTRGYAAARSSPSKNEDARSDKDMILNTMGYHHFHIDAATAKGGHAVGPDELIFAHVTRNTFRVIAMLDHKVFKIGSAERSRLRAMHIEIASQDALPGSALLMGNVVPSGHNLSLVRYADRCEFYINKIDPQMESPEQVKAWFLDAGLTPPKEPRFEWIFDHLDLGFRENTTQAPFWVREGWN
jgi:hypothetical protein